MNNIGTIQLETERLILRRFNENDYKGMYDNWASDLELISMFHISHVKIMKKQNKL